MIVYGKSIREELWRPQRSGDAGDSIHGGTIYGWFSRKCQLEMDDDLGLPGCPSGNIHMDLEIGRVQKKIQKSQGLPQTTWLCHFAQLRIL